MRQALKAAAVAILFTVGSGTPGLAQGFVDASGLRGAGGFGAGVGAAVGTNKAKQLNSTTGTPAAKKLNQVAGNKYLLANQLEKAGKLAEAAAMFAQFAAERQQLYGPGDNEILKAYDKAADLASRAGKKADAEKYMRSALLVCQRTSGSGSPEVKQRLAKLGDKPPVTNSSQTVVAPASQGVPPSKTEAAPTTTPSDPPAANSEAGK